MKSYILVMKLRKIIKKISSPIVRNSIVNYIKYKISY